jgi:hypothetical protein
MQITPTCDHYVRRMAAHSSDASAPDRSGNHAASARCTASTDHHIVVARCVRNALPPPSAAAARSPAPACDTALDRDHETRSTRRRSSSNNTSAPAALNALVFRQSRGRGFDRSPHSGVHSIPSTPHAPASRLRPVRGNTAAKSLRPPVCRCGMQFTMRARFVLRFGRLILEIPRLEGITAPISAKMESAHGKNCARARYFCLVLYGHVRSSTIRR